MRKLSVSRKRKKCVRIVDKALEENKKRTSMKQGISIIIPTCFEDEDIGEQVRNLLLQDYDDYEIIVVNGNKKRKIAIKNPKVRVVNEKQRMGRSAARNT